MWKHDLKQKFPSLVAASPRGIDMFLQKASMSCHVLRSASCTLVCNGFKQFKRREGEFQDSTFADSGQRSTRNQVYGTKISNGICFKEIGDYH